MTVVAQQCELYLMPLNCTLQMDKMVILCYVYLMKEMFCNREVSFSWLEVLVQ